MCAGAAAAAARGGGSGRGRRRVRRAARLGDHRRRRRRQVTSPTPLVAEMKPEVVATMAIPLLFFQSAALRGLSSPVEAAEVAAAVL